MCHFEWFALTGMMIQAIWIAAVGRSILLLREGWKAGWCAQTSSSYVTTCALQHGCKYDG
jgi:hypothetical protein